MKTLRQKLIIYFSIILLSVTLSLCIYYYDINKNVLETNLISTTENNIEYIHSNMNKLLVRCEKLSDYIYLNRSIGKILVRDYDNQNKDYNNLDLDIMAAYNSLRERVDNETISPYISSILIKGKNGKYIKYGMESDYFMEDKLMKNTWFSENINEQTMRWLGIKKNDAKIRLHEYTIPIVRTVISADTHKTIGWQFISISPNLIAEALEDFEFQKRDILLIYDQQFHCIYSNRGELQGEDISSILTAAEGEKYPMVNYDNKSWIQVSNTSAYTGFTIVQLVNYKVIEQQNKMLVNSTCMVLGVSISLAIFLTFFLSNNLTKPLKRISKKMGQISSGDFTRTKELEGTDEIGILGKGINDLAQNIDELLGKIRKEEALKKELEYKTLQSQVNPHFVYNVLNSIRIMSELQGESGIQKMVTNFGELLKEVSKGVDEYITIEKEFELLDRYIYIQKIRKKGLIRVNYKISASCQNCKILKFILQPLVENAIIHGLEGKKGMGYLTITAEPAGEDMCVMIKDNGVGITAKERAQMFTKETGSGVKYNNLGVKSVKERIQLLYGKEYGVFYESEVGEYTVVKVLLPREKMEDDNV